MISDIPPERSAEEAADPTGRGGIKHEAKTLEKMDWPKTGLYQAQVPSSRLSLSESLLASSTSFLTLAAEFLFLLFWSLSKFLQLLFGIKASLTDNVWS